MITVTKAQMSFIDLRVQGEPDRFMKDEAHNKRSLIQSLLMNVLQFPMCKARQHGVPRYLSDCKGHRETKRQSRSS